MKQDYERRFSTLSRLYGEAGLQKLEASHVVVIGMYGIVVIIAAFLGIVRVSFQAFDAWLSWVCLVSQNDNAIRVWGDVVERGAESFLPRLVNTFGGALAICAEE